MITNAQCLSLGYLSPLKPSDAQDGEWLNIEMPQRVQNNPAVRTHERCRAPVYPIERRGDEYGNVLQKVRVRDETRT